MRIFFFESVGSTNDEVGRLLNGGTEPVFAVVAARQTNGRGCRGNQWISRWMGNVYCSVALPSEIFSTQSPAMFSQTFILSFLERMEPAIHLNVKWPNDVFIDGKKVGGVLLEASFSGNVLKRAVLGVGINVVSAPGREAPLETAYEAAALQTYCPSLSLSSVLMEVIQAVEDGINLYKNGAQCEFIANNWKKFDMLHHRQVDVRFNGATFSGKILGVDSDGRLILRLNAGKRMFFESAEAKIIL